MLLLACPPPADLYDAGRADLLVAGMAQVRWLAGERWRWRRGGGQLGWQRHTEGHHSRTDSMFGYKALLLPADGGAGCTFILYLALLLAVPYHCRSVRMLGLAFLLMAGLGAMVEERGLSSRSILNNPDLRPQSETTTKFADVKGVDEAKVGRGGCRCC